MRHPNVFAIDTQLMADHLLASGDDTECGVCKLLNAYGCEVHLDHVRRVSWCQEDCTCHCQDCGARLAECECDECAAPVAAAR